MQKTLAGCPCPPPVNNWCPIGSPECGGGGSAECGDNHKELGEMCDDGDLSDGDGCDSTCDREIGWTCTGPTNGHSTCTPICGDFMRVGGEQCEQNTTVDSSPPTSGDGCSATCQVEAPTWGCSWTPFSVDHTTGGSICTLTQVCGNGTKEGTETCDQGGGNTAINDGCNASCQQEGGWNCIGVGATSCTPVCGDGQKVGGETCDQGGGNTAINDGCNASCQQEGGWTCVGVGPTSCTLNQVCPNGIKEGTEQCDDNNTSGACVNCQNVQSGYYCDGEGAGSCATRCGDTIQAGLETCDDGSGYHNPGYPLIVGSDPRTEECPYSVTMAGSECEVCNSSCQRVPGDTDFCGDAIVDAGYEGCDYDSQSPTIKLPIPHNDDGCTTTCTVEPGWSCFPDYLGRNVCIFHCGDEVPESTVLYTEQCDNGKQGSIDRRFNGTGPTSAPFNGDRCTTETYGETCNWCTLDCRLETSQGQYCGDGMVNGTERCDDGNFDAGDGCSNCAVENGWYCKGIFSTCTTKCGDTPTPICVTNKETCVSCSADCGACPVRRPGVALTHDANLFVNFFEKLKSTFIRPIFLIDIPGLNTSAPKTETPALPPPIESTYDIGTPTTISVGEQNYTFTVFESDPVTGSVTFSVK